MELGITKTKVALAIAAVIIVAALGRSYGYVRATIGLLAATGALYLGFTYFRAAGEVPPDEEAEELNDPGFKYVCTMCGLELRVEVASTDRAPTHCREKMQLVRALR